MHIFTAYENLFLYKDIWIGSIVYNILFYSVLVLNMLDAGMWECSISVCCGQWFANILIWWLGGFRYLRRLSFDYGCCHIWLALWGWVLCVNVELDLVSSVVDESLLFCFKPELRSCFNNCLVWILLLCFVNFNYVNTL